MSELSKEQEIQENQYAFPYHYLPTFDNGNFSENKSDLWGYRYLTYIHYVRDLVEKINPKNLLDVGCGDGRFTHEMYKVNQYREMLGIDYSKRAIAIATALNPHLIYRYGDITDQHTLSKKYECITLIETLEHIPLDKINTFVKGLSDNLEKNGILIITVPSDNTPIRPKHFQHFNETSLTKTVEKYLTVHDIHFVNQISQWVTLIEKLLINRLFITNDRTIKNILYNLYKKYLFHGNKHNTGRIIAVCIKK